MAFRRNSSGSSDGTDGGESGIQPLGLSLNGRFEVDPTEIPHSSSVGGGGGSSSHFPAPVRAYSMPALGKTGNKPEAPRLVADDVAAATRTKEHQSPMAGMPTVTTVGPNDRRVNGILYQYSREDEITIICVCHGSFMSPAQFVQHAGGEVVNNGWSQITMRPGSVDNR